jgi:hypothetical protein
MFTTQVQDMQKYVPPLAAEMRKKVKTNHKLNFLYHLVTNDRAKPDPRYILSIQVWPRPLLKPLPLKIVGKHLKKILFFKALVIAA